MTDPLFGKKKRKTAKFDLTKIDTEHFLEVMKVENLTRATEEEWMFSCPFTGHAHGDQSPSAYMNEETTAWMCFAGETQVLTKQGHLPIGSIAGKTEVLTRGGVWSKAVFSCYGKDRLLKVVISRNGIQKSVHATPSHRWFARNTGARKFQELTTEDLVRGQVLESSFPKWSPVKSKTGLSPTGIQHGVVFGDGHKTINGARAEIFEPKDSDLLQWFRGHRKLTYGPKTVVADLPNHFKDLPDLDDGASYLHGWLAGYFAADGDIAKDGCCSLNSAKFENLIRVREICDRLGIGTSSISHYERPEKLPDGRGWGTSKIYRIRVYSEDLVPDFFLLDVHRSRFESHKKRCERRRWVVIDVEETSRFEDVYCCVVDHPSHSFALEDNILTGNCHGCKRSGNAITFYEEYENVTRQQARHDLQKRYGGKSPDPDEYSVLADLERMWAKAEREREVVKGNQVIDDSVAEEWSLDWAAASEAMEEGEEIPDEMVYMFDRGFDAETLDAWQIGWDEYRERIMIPVRGASGMLFGFKGRAVRQGHKPKYLVMGGDKYDYPRYEKSLVVFGLDRVVAKYGEGADLILCEGELDVISMHSKGFDTAVCVAGSDLSQNQARLIRRWGSTATIFFDSDEGGESGTRKVIDALHKFIPLRVVPDHEGDPADLSSKEIAQLINESETVAKAIILSKGE